MKRPWHVWCVFLLSLAVVVSALAWVSALVLRLDASDARARANAEYEEDVRLALWRMESYVSGLVAQESSRPYFMYSSVYPAERAYSAMLNDLNRDVGTLLIPSPLMTQTPPHVRLHFQYDAGGQLSSPQVPNDPSNRRIADKYVAADGFASAESDLAAFARLMSRETLARRVPDDLGPPAEMIAFAPELSNSSRLRGGNRSQRDVANQEFQVRQLQNLQQQAVSNAVNSFPLPTVHDVRSGMMHPMWVGENLVLARRVAVGDKELLQGAWLDRPSLEGTLLSNVSDIFPRATLQPVESHLARPDRALAALPLYLDPGEAAVFTVDPFSPIRVSLYVAWGCVLLAILAVAALLLGVLRLSERRASFVSSVTHELRTPLTTFRMYAEMLAGGMVPDGSRRKQYLETLRVEADRLSHLVENVLSYARLERGRRANRLEAVTVGSLLAKAEDRLRDRAAEVDLELQMDVSGDERALRAKADPGVVEQVLFNLVDNACKYATDSEPPVIQISVQAEGGHVGLAVRDHGPGINGAQRRRLFHPFSKSAEQAATTAPGVGLGLALSRRLARQMGGNLRLRHGPDRGAVFVLSLRRAD